MPSVARVVDGRIEMDRSFDQRACFLVFAIVAAWDETVFASPDRGVPALEDAVVNAATGFRVDAPLPFRITGAYAVIKASDVMVGKH